MDITLNRDALADKLSEVVAIASRKATIPALNGVLIDAADKLASFSATDMEISARVACAAQVATPGRALLPAKRLNDIVRLLPNDSAVRIASDGASARIECGRYNSKLQTFSAEDFPSFPPAATDAKAIHVSGETVAALIRKVKHAAMGDTDVRYFLAGAFMILAGPRITLVATDGRRLAIASAARPNGPDASVLISSRVLSELTAMFEHVDGAVAFNVDSNHLRFACGNRLLVATKIDGQFPSHERVMPKENDKSVAFERDEMIEALRRVSLATTGNTRPVSFDVQKNGVKLVAASADVAEAVEHVDGAVKGGSVKVSLDSAAVLDFLDAAEPGKIVIELKDATTAALLRQVDERDTTYRCVVMPIVQATS
jgi:DNA polymerase-3 subunit beta